MEKTLTIERVEYALDARFASCMDLSDIRDNVPSDNRRKSFLSRSIAALCVMALADVEPEIAARSVVDSWGDCGLDAIFFDESEGIPLHRPVQVYRDGNKVIELGHVLKFLEGVRKLISSKIDNFNEKINRRAAEINPPL